MSRARTTNGRLLAAGHIAVYDTEFAWWPGALERDWTGPGEHREIVHIGAVLLDENRHEESALCALVRPVANPVLSDYFFSLTGITNGDAEAEGWQLSEVLREFRAFCSRGSVACSFGPDHKIIQENCDSIGLQNPLAAVTMVDNREWLCDVVEGDRDAIDSATLPVLFGLVAQPKAHDGLSTPGPRPASCDMSFLDSSDHV